MAAYRHMKEICTDKMNQIKSRLMQDYEGTLQKDKDAESKRQSER